MSKAALPQPKKAKGVRVIWIFNSNSLWPLCHPFVTPLSPRPYSAVIRLSVKPQKEAI